MRQWQINLFTPLQLVVETFELIEPTNQNSIKVINIVKPKNKNTMLENFGD